MAQVIVGAKGLVGKMISVQSKERREGNIEVLQISVPHGGAGLTQEALGFLSSNIGKQFVVDLALDDGTGELEFDRGAPPTQPDADGQEGLERD